MEHYASINVSAPISAALETIFLSNEDLGNSQLDNEPPAKRRKLLERHEQQLPNQAKQGDSNVASFMFSKVTLDITFAPSAREMRLSEGHNIQPVQPRKMMCGGDKSLYLVQSLENETLFAVQLPADHAEDITEILDSAITCCDRSFRGRGKYSPRWEMSSTIENRGVSSLRWIVDFQQANDDNDGVQHEHQTWSPGMFYNSVYVPHFNASPGFPIPTNFECNLYPFQNRAVAWMLGREGIALNDDKNLMIKEQYTIQNLDFSCGSPLQHNASEVPIFYSDETYKSMNGGILAEEMGLGKTVEVLALICVHTRSATPRELAFRDPAAPRNAGVDQAALFPGMAKKAQQNQAISAAQVRGIPHRLPDDECSQTTFSRNSSDPLHNRIPSAATLPSSRDLEQCSATLIITPPAILEQWKREIRTHTPKLKVFVYKGMSQSQQSLERSPEILWGETAYSNDTIPSVLCSYDIVLTTYNVLSKEIHYATEIPDRATRSGTLYKRQRSPLVRLDWWRVILDEAQMLESGVSNAAKVARLIPRQNAWAVSGTPVRKDAEDLRGLLIFLGIEPYASSQRLWHRTVTCYPRVFQRIFRTIALRHTKENIRREITLPPQKRVVVNMAFSHIEEQNYSQMFQELCKQLGVDHHGQPLPSPPKRDPISVDPIMRGWLTRLRQVCLHPEVGDRNRAKLGRRKAPRTVDQVLNVMTEQNETALLAEERSLLMSKVRRGQVLEHAGNSQGALEIWESCLRKSEGLVHNCRRQLSVLLDGKHESTECGRLDDVAEFEKCDEAERSHKGLDTKANESLHLAICRQRLRSVIELEHLCTFFVANACYQIKSQPTEPAASPTLALGDKEEAAYDHAKLLRKELLVESERRAERWMGFVRSSTTKATHIPEMKEVLLGTTNSKARNICTRLIDLLQVLDRQTDLIEEMQSELKDLLCSPLVDQEDPQEVQGDEYETSTKQQDDLYAHVDVFRAVIFDRHEAISGQKNNRIDHEMEKLLKDAKSSSGHSPELFLKLAASRQLHKPMGELGSIKGLLTELRELKASLKAHAGQGASQRDGEVTDLVSLLEVVQEISNSQGKLSAALEKQSELFTDTMNARLEYYKQLQRISDTVMPLEVDYTDSEREDVLSKMQEGESKIEAELAKLKSKARYLMHLREEASMTSSVPSRICVICRSEFEEGFLTSCGHVYCCGCLQTWRKIHSTCPTCKKKLSSYDLHRIAEKPQDLFAEEETIPSRRALSSSSTPGPDAIYVGVRTSVLDEIKNIEIPRSYSTKVDTLTRHILWLRDQDPGAKSVIFSQYRDFLKLLKAVFIEAKIGCATIEEKDGITKFKTDASVECFFLHAQAQSSGLNLVEATHVFLCEPLLNTAIELQAIARVHRIGQHSPTTVWMYIIDGTVEKAIYELSMQRRMSHRDKVRSKSDPQNGVPSHIDKQDMDDERLEAANTRELQEAAIANLFSKGRNSSGDEVVAQSDIWKCLFGQQSKEDTLDEHDQDSVPEDTGKDTIAEACSESAE